MRLDPSAMDSVLDLARWRARQAAVREDPLPDLLRTLRAVQAAPTLSIARNLAAGALARMGRAPVHE